MDRGKLSRDEYGMGGIVDIDSCVIGYNVPLQYSRYSRFMGEIRIGFK